MFRYKNKYHLIVVELKYKKTLEEAFNQVINKRYVDRSLGYVQQRSDITVDDCYIYVVAGNMDEDNQVH